MPLNADTLDILDKVKKGGPARFIMITKGTKVLNLVVYRKGAEDTHLKEAKKNGVGEIAKGLVEGSGQTMTFKLARVDYAEEPVKDPILKTYMNENGFPCKPTIELVDVLPEFIEEGTVLPKLPSTPSPTNNPTAQNPTKPVTTPTPNQTPTPNGPQVGTARRPIQREQQAGQYRTRADWDRIFAALSKAPEGPAKKSVIEKTINDLKREKIQAQSDAKLTQDAGRELDTVHAYVAQQLRTFVGPPSTGGQTGQTTTAQTPRPMPQVPPTPNQAPRGAQVPQKSKEDQDRDLLTADVKRRGAAVKAKINNPHIPTDLKKIIADCETDADSDFGKVCAAYSIRSVDTYETAVANIREGERLARKYIKDHPDPKVGKLPTRVVNRRTNCEKFITEYAKMLGEIHAVDASAFAMAQTYGKLLENKEPIPASVAVEIKDMLKTAKISKANQDELNRIADEILKADQARGYAKLNSTQNPTDLQKADILLKHGCFSGGGGGTSDVRLLRNPDKSVAFAFKGKEGEAQGALDMLNLPKGASATREDLCSKLTEEIFAQTGIDFGFPKSSVVKIEGETGALIEGIKGVTVDTEERATLATKCANKNVDPSVKAELAEVERRLKEIPTKLTAESLQKTVLFSTLSCQWDCKWGNLMVENESNARPIDGGGAFPTQDCIDSFGRDYKVVPLNIKSLVQYPPTDLSGANRDKPLPQATQPMDPNIVRAMLNLDVNKLIATLKARRDEIARNNPDLAQPPHTGGLVDDATFDRVKKSIEASQAILRKQPTPTLEQFADDYGDWWAKWITANRGPNAAIYNVPDEVKAQMQT